MASESLEERERQMRTTATLVRVYRERRRWSQSALARAAGVHHSYITRLELAERHAGVDYLDAIATALELSSEEHDVLRMGAGYSPVSSTGNQLMAQILREPAVLALLTLFRDVTVPDAALDSVRQGVSALVAAVHAAHTAAR